MKLRRRDGIASRGLSQPSILWIFGKMRGSLLWSISHWRRVISLTLAPSTCTTFGGPSPRYEPGTQTETVALWPIETGHRFWWPQTFQITHPDTAPWVRPWRWSWRDSSGATTFRSRPPVEHRF